MCEILGIFPFWPFFHFAFIFVIFCLTRRCRKKKAVSLGKHRWAKLKKSAAAAALSELPRGARGTKSAL